MDGHLKQTDAHVTKKTKNSAGRTGSVSLGITIFYFNVFFVFFVFFYFLTASVVIKVEYLH